VKKKVFLAMLGVLAAFNEALFVAVCGDHSCAGCFLAPPLCRRARKLTEDVKRLAVDVGEKG
jgi:hypothetical protein